MSSCFRERDFSEKRIRKIEIPKVFTKEKVVNKTNADVGQPYQRGRRASNVNEEVDISDKKTIDSVRQQTSDFVTKALPLGEAVDDASHDGAGTPCRKPRAKVVRRMSSNIRRIQDKIRREQTKDAVDRELKGAQHQQNQQHCAVAMSAVVAVKNARRQRSRSRTKRGKMRYDQLQRPYRRWLGVSTCVVSDTRFIVGPLKTDETINGAGECKNNNETNDGSQSCSANVHHSPQASPSEISSKTDKPENELHIVEFDEPNVVSEPSIGNQTRDNGDSSKSVRKANYRKKGCKKHLRFRESETLQNSQGQENFHNLVGENITGEANELTTITKSIAAEPVEIADYDILHNKGIGTVSSSRECGIAFGKEYAPSPEEYDMPSDKECNIPSTNENDTPSVNIFDVPFDKEYDIPSDKVCDIPCDKDCDGGFSVNFHKECDIPFGKRYDIFSNPGCVFPTTCEFDILSNSEHDIDIPFTDEPNIPDGMEFDIPSPNESDIPSVCQSWIPSANGSDMPSVNESDNPSVYQSWIPSANGSDMPSANESDIPSVNQSLIPSANGFDILSANESDIPSVNQSWIPSANGFDMPSANESDIPSVNQSWIPSANGFDMPSANESDIPSANESDIPSANEGDIPSVNQSWVPSVNEYDIPSANESDLLSVNEGDIPSANEYDIPSAYECDIPSVNERDILSDNEGDTPTVNESGIPSGNEYDIPTANEGDIPSAKGNDIPTVNEGDIPSPKEYDIPSTNESDIPSANESNIPTVNEGDIPSANEYDIPSSNEYIPSADEYDIPSANEYDIPSANETDIPSANETDIPSANEADMPSTKECDITSVWDYSVPGDEIHSFIISENNLEECITSVLSNTHVHTKEPALVDYITDEKNKSPFDIECENEFIIADLLYSRGEFDILDNDSSFQSQEQGMDKDSPSLLATNYDQLTSSVPYVSTVLNEGTTNEALVILNPSTAEFLTHPEGEGTKTDCLKSNHESGQEVLGSPQLGDTKAYAETCFTRSEAFHQSAKEEFKQKKYDTDCKPSFSNIDHSSQVEEEDEYEKDSEQYLSSVETAEKLDLGHPQIPETPLLLPTMNKSENEPALLDSSSASNLIVHSRQAPLSKTSILSLHTFSSQGGLAGKSVSEARYEFMDPPAPVDVNAVRISKDTINSTRLPAKNSLREEMRTFRDRQLFEMKAFTSPRTSTFKWFTKKFKKSKTKTEYIDVLAIKDCQGTLPGQLSFKKGQTIKQLDTGLRDVDGMYYGYYRAGRLGKKVWGIYPCSYISLFFDDEDDESKEGNDCDGDGRADETVDVSARTSTSKP